MDILLIFNERPRSSNKEQAIKIANECNCIIENERIKVIFHEVGDPHFKKLLTMCSQWTTAELYIDDTEYAIPTISGIINCNMMSRCNGFCEINYRNNRYNYELIIRAFFQMKSLPFSRNDLLSDSLRIIDFLQKEDENSYFVKKEELITKIIEDSKIPLTFCQIINEEKIINKINTLPEKIKIRDKTHVEMPKVYPGMSEFEKAHCKEKAEIMAPIFAREIKKELIKLFQEINDASNKEQK